MKKEGIAETHIQDTVLYEALPRMPMSLEGVSVSDIPIKYFRPEAVFPSNGFSIDATPADINKLIKNCGTTKESD